MPDDLVDPLRIHDRRPEATETHELLGRVLAELREIRAELRRRDEDDERLRAFVLLYELEAVASGKEFTAGEACAHARLPENGRLRAAIEAACAKLSARILGKFLAKWGGRKVGSLWCERIGCAQGLLLWQVSSTQTNTRSHWRRDR